MSTAVVRKYGQGGLSRNDGLRRLSRQRELHRDAEVLCGGGIAAAGEQGRVGLAVVVGGEGEIAREGVGGSERNLQCRVAAAGRGDASGDVARDGGLLAQRDVEARVQVVVHAAAVAGLLLLVVVVVLTALLRALHTAVAGARAEEVEVGELIGKADDPVLRFRLVQLDAGHREGELARGLVFQLHGQVVLQRDVGTEQRREGLVDADGGDVEHRGGGVAAVGGLHVAQVAHVFEPGAVAGVGANAVDARVSVVDVDALEAVGEEGNLRQSAVAHVPVGQQAREGGEDVERVAGAHGVGAEEGGNKHVGRVGVDGVGRGGYVAPARFTRWILGLHAVAELGNGGAELVERLRGKAVVGVAHALEGAT